jgi:signal transduction histidine kinase
MNRNFNILYVDDEVSNLNVFKNTFRRVYNIFTAESAHEGLEILSRENIDLIITDQRMPEMTGVEFLKEAIVKYPQPSRILITAYTDFEALKEAVNDAKIFQFIQKPWDEKEIQLIIDSALEIYSLKKINNQLNKDLEAKNKELEKLNSELLELDKLKTQFLNIISHEIRTPLNGISLATQLFRAELTDADFEKYQSFFSFLETSADRLEHFLLLAERITAFKAQKYHFEPAQFDINTLINKVIKNLSDRIDRKNISITQELCDMIGLGFFGDDQLIEICLYEIIDNAIKYSKDGDKVHIYTFISNFDQIIQITDHGPGFPDIVLKHIFEPFITSDELGRQGMGLDLALIKLIIEAHDGWIKIRNNEPVGSTVSLTFRKAVELKPGN